MPPGMWADRYLDHQLREICDASNGMAEIHQPEVCQERYEVMTTLKAALYGNPMGMLAKTASNLFARGDLKAKLWEISWIARKRF